MINVSPDILINPHKVLAIETRYHGKKKVYIAIVGNKSYEIKVDIQTFLGELQPDMGTQHHFAG